MFPLLYTSTPSRFRQLAGIATCMLTAARSWTVPVFNTALMTQMPSISESQTVYTHALELPTIIFPPASRPQSTTHGHVDFPLTPARATTRLSPYVPRLASDASMDLEANIDAKATVQRPAIRSAMSLSHSDTLPTIWAVFVAICFIALSCTIVIFAISSILTLLGAHLLSENPAFPPIITWRHMLAAGAIGSAILGTFIALAIVIICADVLQHAPVSVVLLSCSIASVFAFALGVAAFPRSVVLSLFTGGTLCLRAPRAYWGCAFSC
ncbi:hypothetical protein BD311DRAFT_748953 [Dichomitus squalens]|uniref:Uncharacterized protein n=1 Tax=Dichomitus squalens TaxID=114155 RepID=A0A4Q9N0H0_9APHY|nr:hypothetical protein BD311DRAFT_748953 [Dichomitus squalens]